jgi:hypothetical protein
MRGAANRRATTHTPSTDHNDFRGWSLSNRTAKTADRILKVRMRGAANSRATTNCKWTDSNQSDWFQVELLIRSYPLQTIQVTRSDSYFFLISKTSGWSKASVSETARGEAIHWASVGKVRLRGKTILLWYHRILIGCHLIKLVTNWDDRKLTGILLNI